MMSCYYKALSRLVPQLLLLARPGSEVILVSPWIADVILHPPLFKHSQQCSSFTEIRLRQLLLALAKDFDMHITVVIRDRDQRAESVLRNWPLPTHLIVKQISHLHAKAIITDDFVLEGSANLLQTSLSRNIETCTLTVNRYGSARRWLNQKLDIQL